MKKSAFILSTALALMPALADAQGAAGGMYGVKEVVVQYAHFADPKAAEDCGLTRENIAKILDKALKNDTVPAIAARDAKPPMMGIARIELVPEISSLDQQGLDCTSWVSLTAQGHNDLVIPPVDAPRSVTVVYWHQGAMVTSGEATHARAISDALEKMERNFANQYHLDQPPEIQTGQ